MRTNNGVNIAAAGPRLVVAGLQAICVWGVSNLPGISKAPESEKAALVDKMMTHTTAKDR
jgi:hypothetical protein